MAVTEAWMMDKENRQDERYACEAAVKWSYFNKRDCHFAKVKNVSLNGLYLESHHPVHPASTIIIRKENCSPHSLTTKDDLYLRTICVADVKWCEEFYGNHTHYYGIGVKFNNQT
jgi:hypothetical protein